MRNFGLAQETQRHTELFSTTKLSQSSAEVNFGGRDKSGQAKSLVPNQSLVSSMLLGQSLLATATSVFVQEKSDHTIKAGIYENPCSIK